MIGGNRRDLILKFPLDVVNSFETIEADSLIRTEEFSPYNDFIDLNIFSSKI